MPSDTPQSSKRQFYSSRRTRLIVQIQYTDGGPIDKKVAFYDKGGVVKASGRGENDTFDKVLNLRAHPRATSTSPRRKSSHEARTQPS